MSERITTAQLHKEVEGQSRRITEQDRRLEKLENNFAEIDKTMAVEFAVMKEKLDQSYKLQTEIKEEQVRTSKEPTDEHKWFKRTILGGAITGIIGYLLWVIGIRK